MGKALEFEAGARLFAVVRGNSVFSEGVPVGITLFRRHFFPSNTDR